MIYVYDILDRISRYYKIIIVHVQNDIYQFILIYNDL